MKKLTVSVDKTGRGDVFYGKNRIAKFDLELKQMPNLARVISNLGETRARAQIGAGLISIVLPPIASMFGIGNAIDIVIKND